MYEADSAGKRRDWKTLNPGPQSSQSTYTYEADSAGKRLVYRFATPLEAKERAQCTLLNPKGVGNGEHQIILQMMVSSHLPLG
jgi:hypothetical protein